MIMFFIIMIWLSVHLSILLLTYFCWEAWGPPRPPVIRYFLGLPFYDHGYSPTLLWSWLILLFLVVLAI